MLVNMSHRQNSGMSVASWGLAKAGPRQYFFEKVNVGTIENDVKYIISS